jgi:hypothetical protein
VIKLLPQLRQQEQSAPQEGEDGSRTGQPLRGTAVLVLLRGGIYEVSSSDGLRWHDIHIPRLVTISSGIQVVLRLPLQQFKRLQYWYY